MIPKPENIAIKARVVCCPVNGGFICLGDSADKLRDILKKTHKHEVVIYESAAYPCDYHGGFFTDYSPPSGECVLEYAKRMRGFRVTKKQVFFHLVKMIIGKA
jgi:hypothetical protein